MRELVEFLARSLAEDPDAVEVTEHDTDGDVVIEITAAEEDLGRLIGRGGRVAAALRTVARAAATREQRRVTLEILD
ncbi:MAG: KH domain-containing protein [Solirubrobacterales bacterium]